MTKLKPILLVEDDPIDATIIQRALCDLQVPNPVVHVRDAEEGLDYLLDCCRELPCLVLLDLTLPRMDGSQLLGLMKRDPVLRALPTAVLTNPDVPHNALGSCMEEADAYIVKAAQYEQYVEDVRKVVCLHGITGVQAL